MKILKKLLKLSNNTEFDEENKFYLVFPKVKKIHYIDQVHCTYNKKLKDTDKKLTLFKNSW